MSDHRSREQALHGVNPNPSLPEQPRLYTRRAAVDYFLEKWGLPITVARMARDSMTAHGRKPVMPAPAKRFGNRFLYTAEQLDFYAKKLLQDGPAERGEAA